MSHALFVNVFGYGHVNPTLGIVKELIDRGEKVTYIAGEEFKEKIETIGAKCRCYKNFNESGFQNGNISFEDIEPQLLEITQLYKRITDVIFSLKEKFDYLIYDSLFFLGSEVARVLGIPAICSCSTFATNYKTDYLSVFINGCKPVLDKLLNGSQLVDTIKYFWKRYGIMVPDFSSLSTIKNDISIVYTSRYFQIFGESFDESYKFIGPSIIDRTEMIDSCLQPDSKKKIIYISLGTVFNESIEFYQSCFKAFENMEAMVIMSVGNNININMFESVPSNFIIRNHVPQLEILKHADVFITHGGMNSVNEGLYYSVPLIVVPQFFDQPIVAYRVAELGAGIVIDKDKVTFELLQQSVVNIFSDKNYETNSKKIGKSLIEAGGYKKGVDEILIINSKPAHSERNEEWHKNGNKITSKGKLIYS